MRRIGVSLVAILFAVGCAQDQTAPEAEEAGPISSLSNGDRLAAWVAGAMAAPETRALVLRVMRESPLSEHAVTLTELIAGPDGDRFVSAVARAGGTTDVAVRSLIASLPALDFYVPAQRDRLDWDGGAELLVAAMPYQETPRAAYSPAGVRRSLDLSAITTEAPLFLLQFAEHKAFRVQPQAARLGGRIQDPDDGELAAAYVGRLAGGIETIIQIRDLPTGPNGAKYCPPDIPGCPPEDGGGGGSGDPPPPQGGPGNTYLTGLETFGECDNGICFESNEFEFHAHSTVGFHVLRLEGVGPTVTWNNISYLIAPYSPTNGVTILMSAWETDGWPNPDDHFWFVINGTYSDPVLQVTPTNNNGQSWPLRKDIHSSHVNLTARYGWSQ